MIHEKIGIQRLLNYAAGDPSISGTGTIQFLSDYEWCPDPMDCSFCENPEDHEICSNPEIYDPRRPFLAKITGDWLTDLYSVLGNFASGHDASNTVARAQQEIDSALTLCGILQASEEPAIDNILRKNLNQSAFSNYAAGATQIYLNSVYGLYNDKISEN